MARPVDTQNRQFALNPVLRPMLQLLRVSLTLHNPAAGQFGRTVETNPSINQSTCFWAVLPDRYARMHTSSFHQGSQSGCSFIPSTPGGGFTTAERTGSP